MRYRLPVVLSSLLVAGTVYAEPPGVDAGYEVKVILDPTTAAAALPALVSGVSAKPRTVIYYAIDPVPNDDTTIVRARRDSKNKTDIDVKLRGLDQVEAWLLGGPRGIEDAECEWDVGMDDEGKLSCDIKVETAGDTSPLDGDSVMARLDDGQRELFKIGTRLPDFQSTLDACPAISTKVWKGIAAVPGCDEATVELWPMADGPVYELSCKTTTLEEARAGLQARMDALGIVADPDQRGKTTRALEECGAE